MNYPEKVYLNGNIIASKNAKISVFDRGFIFGDGLYEVMVQIGGDFFYKKAHLDRLQSGLEKINISFDLSHISFEIDKLLAANKLTEKDCLLYIQITRGVAPRQHSYPKNAKPTVMMYAVPKKLPDINNLNAKVITANDFRWTRCDIKITSLLGNVMLNEHAMENECYETVLLRNGVVTEASHCNVFFVKGGEVFTHPADEFILDGITRQIVLQLCERLKIAVKEIPIAEKEIYLMDEAFLVGTSTQIASIQKINDHYYCLLYTSDAADDLTRVDPSRC